ncbi:MAG: outer membrane protein assembly factor BamB [Burkholderiales bacterium]|nr:outer membrane protein assembly factor BamB [Burkholderiales bacterium]
MTGGATAFRLAAAAALLALAGCQTVSGYYDSLYDSLFASAPTQKPAPLLRFEPSASVRTVWKAKVGEAGSYVFFPAVDSDSVYAASKENLVRYDLLNTAAWRVDPKQVLSGGVGADGNLVLVGTPKGEVLAFDRRGELLWRTNISSEVLSAPQAADGIVVVRAGDGRIFGLDAIDGKRKWVYQRATPALTVRSHAGVVIFGKAVFAGFPGGKLVALNLANGNVGWEATVAQPRGATELERVTDITSLPAVDDRQVCAAAFQGRVACFDTARGTLLWARDISSISGLATDSRAVYVVDDKSAVIALDKASGANIWKHDKLNGRRLSGPYVHRDWLIVGDYQGYVHVLNLDDGSFAARLETDGSPVFAPPVPLGDNIVVQTRSGGLYAVAVR